MVGSFISPIIMGEHKSIPSLYIAYTAFLFFLAFVVFYVVLNEPYNERKGKEASCVELWGDSYSGVIVYKDKDYVVLSGNRQTFMGMTGGVMVPDGESPGVQSYRVEGGVPIYENKAGEFVLKRSDCVRKDMPEKYRDMVAEQKAFERDSR